MCWVGLNGPPSHRAKGEKKLLPVAVEMKATYAGLRHLRSCSTELWSSVRVEIEIDA